MKISKKEYLTVLCGLGFDETETDYIRTESFRYMFAVLAETQLTKHVDLHTTEQVKNLPLVAIKQMVGLAYHAILKKIGRDDPRTLNTLENAINHLSQHELELEWESITDGTVSRIVDTMLNWGSQSETTKQDIANIFEGLAVPYFRDYKGKVPKEDMEWAHKMVRDYFKNLKASQPALTGKQSPALPEAKKNKSKGRCDK